MDKVYAYYTTVTPHFVTLLKVLICMVIMVASMMLFMSNITSAAASNLKTDIMIEGEDITVGDIFNDVEVNASYVLGPAPAPGEKMVLKPSTLVRIAKAFNIAWTPSHQGQTATIRRSANIIGMKDTTREIVKSLKDEMNMGDFDIELDTSKFYISLPEDTPRTMRIENLNIDSARKRFSATLVAPALGLALAKKEVSGSYFHVTNVPVLRERLRHGDVISKHDIDYIQMRDETIAPHVLTNTDHVIGFTPRRAILAGTPMQVNELVAPKMIDRGDQVTIVYSKGPIRLSAQGRALQAGAKNEIIRVTNMTSNRTIEALVTAEREVRVEAN